MRNARSIENLVLNDVVSIGEINVMQVCIIINYMFQVRSKIESRELNDLVPVKLSY